MFTLNFGCIQIGRFKNIFAALFIKSFSMFESKFAGYQYLYIVKEDLL